jgi:hypothetical protein
MKGKASVPVFFTAAVQISNRHGIAEIGAVRSIPARGSHTKKQRAVRAGKDICSSIVEVVVIIQPVRANNDIAIAIAVHIANG